MRKLAALMASLALAACAGMMSGDKAVAVKLSGAEEVPPVSVPGSGGGRFMIGKDGSVSGSVTTVDVPGTVAHIHLGARGQNGPVVIPLVKNGDTYSAPAGARLNEEQMKAFREGRLYVNVHTARNKPGEVRGQLLP